MRILRDLQTIYGEVLVRKDVEITPRIVKMVRDAGAKHENFAVPLKNTAIFTDFQKTFDNLRYANMLKSPAVKKEICDIAGSLEIENDLIFELNTMKLNLPYTYNHAMIVAALAIRLSLAYKPNIYDRMTTARCGFTHDIGKTRIPISILNKHGKLTEKERAIIETHPIMGYLLLSYYLKKDRDICSLANLDHHERLDGSGYPKGVMRIGKYAQLISVVDVLDALMTKRPYRKKAYTLRASLDYLLKQAYMKKIDAKIVLSLISLARKEKPDLQHIKISKEVREELPD